jgi:hypothetical protein
MERVFKIFLIDAVHAKMDLKSAIAFLVGI